MMEPTTTQDLVEFVPYLSVPLLALVVLGFVLRITHRSEIAGAIDSRGAWHLRALVAVWALWGFTSAALALSGRYTSDTFYQLLPGLWMPFVPVLIFGVYSAWSSSFREAIGKVIDTTPLHWLVYFQALRISAIGTAFETAKGNFPASFELFVGLPDLLFGLSALYVGKRVRDGSISHRGVALWSLLGFLAVVPSAPLVAQMGLPGPLMVFAGEPSATVLFVYPMVLAPTLIVPLFVLFNLLTALRLWRTSAAGANTAPALARAG